MIPSDVLISSPVVQAEAVNQQFPGVDASLDPELALALRVSMEEERARQQALSGTPAAPEEEPTVAEPQPMEEDEDALLQRALAMSMKEETPPMDDEDPDDQMQLALQMSMQEAPAKEEKDEAIFHDPSFVNQMLSELPGVDPNDPTIQAALARIRGDDKDDDKNDDQKKDK